MARTPEVFSKRMFSLGLGSSHHKSIGLRLTLFTIRQISRAMTLIKCVFF